MTLVELYKKYKEMYPCAFKGFEEGLITEKDLRKFLTSKSEISHGKIQDDDDDEDDEDEVDDIEPPEYPNTPNLADLKSDFQLLDYSDFTGFLASVFSFKNSIGENFLCEDLKEQVLEFGALEPISGNDTENDFVRNTRELCKISYIEYMISRQMEYMAYMDIDIEFIVMSKEYFLFSFNLANSYYDRTEDERFYDTFREGKIYEIPILISKYSKVPLVIHDLTESDPGKTIKGCKILTNKKLIESYADVFNEKGSIKKDVMKAEDLISHD